MPESPPPEFFYLAQAYFHQDFSVLYGDLGELVDDIVEGFDSYGSPPVLKRYIENIVPRLSDSELTTLWANTNAQVELGSPTELRRILNQIAAAL